MKLFISFLLISVFYYSHGQNWKAFGVMNNVPRCFYEDTMNNKLIIGGNFSLFNSDTAFGVVSWDGTSFKKMGCGFNVLCSSPPHPVGIYPTPSAFCYYKETLYATGGLRYAGGLPSHGLAYWDGDNWKPIESGLRDSNGDAGFGNSLKVINNELYVCGFFENCNGINANSIAKFNGVTWQSVHDIPQFSSDPSFIFDVAFYKGYLYVGGDFFDENNMSGDRWDIVRYNGSTWEGVGGGIKGGFSYIARMLVYKDKLYMAGSMNKQIGNPGNGIAAWDGEQWDDVGGGLDYNGEIQVRDMKIFDDKLYVVGNISRAGGVSAWDIAYWDGENWCGLGTRTETFDNQLGCLGTYRDSLYIGGGFWSVDGDSSISRIAKWAGGDYTEACGNTTGNPPQPEKVELLVYPNPANDLLNIELPQNSGDLFLEIFSVTGQRLLNARLYSSSQEIRISHLPPGLYLAKLTNKNGISSTQRIVIAR